MVAAKSNSIMKAVLSLIWPLFVLPYFLVKYLYKGLLGWWLDPWLLEKDQKQLLRDVLDCMPFLASNGIAVKGKPFPRRFDYSSVLLDLENIRVRVARGRGELAVSLSPQSSLLDWYDLGIVLEALGSGLYEHEIPLDMREFDKALEINWKTIQTEFSESRYSEFKDVLSQIRRDQQRATREAEWQLAKHLGHLRR